VRLNTLKPAPGSRPAGKRLGRGQSAGQGKTSGRGVKGQHARSGGYHRRGFEGGQMPLQRRLPKIGFVSRTKALSAEVRVHELARFDGQTVDLAMLKTAGIVPKSTLKAKVIASGSLDKTVTLSGILVTAGAKRIIEAAGGSVE
jgi:large subunit ribosomal protein L15